MTNKSSSNPVMATGVDSSAKNTTQTDQLEKGNGMATLTLTMMNKSSSNPVMATGVDSSAKKTTLTDQLEKDILQNNKTVTNSDSVVLNRNSTNCCLGNLAFYIYYNRGNGKTHALTTTNYSFLNNVWATGAVTRS
ncbi:uncharacterized protein LOC128189869 isoform X1 [Crassostrea angulata]|uniref:uncharacterized protein LOC128189869 isoform X1 n=1 Tax=Magallana angulata TaxID=2784310 RepID=UPI0022B0B023|nr:uncharacterized protein LOC128189869 isoform X1 [Crassostrea angulata]